MLDFLLRINRVSDKGLNYLLNYFKDKEIAILGSKKNSDIFRNKKTARGQGFISFASYSYKIDRRLNLLLGAKYISRVNIKACKLVVI